MIVGAPAALRAAQEQNFRQLRRYPLDAAEQQQLALIERWWRARYTGLLPVMQQRLQAGHVIDGHGDCHLGNMAVIDGAVRLFDCIEFNADFRIIDSIAEIALLDMDVNARGHPAESRRLLTDYLEYSGDYAGLQLLDLYRCYFALVRAKVKLLRYPPTHPGLAATTAYAEARHYLALAHSYTQQPRLFLAITHGLSGSGKSTVAGKLVEASNAVRIRSDVERKRLFGLAPEQRSNADDAAQLYSDAMTARTFEQLAVLATTILNAGFSVIVDTTFLHRRVRDQFRQLAQGLHTPFAILNCSAAPGVLRQRLLARERSAHDASEANVAVMERQRQQLEPLADVELAAAVATESGASPAALWRQLRAGLGWD